MVILFLAITVLALCDFRKFVVTLKNQPTPDSVLYRAVKSSLGNILGDVPFSVIMFLYIGLIIPYLNLYFLLGFIILLGIYKLFFFLDGYVERNRYKK